MPTTIQNIKLADLFAILQEEYNVQPQQKLNITFEVQSNFEQDYDIENVNDSILEALKEVKAHREGKLELPDAEDVLNEL